MSRSTNDYNVVYSTDGGRVPSIKKEKVYDTGDGIVRIRRETKGRKGKGVTTISNAGTHDGELKVLCKSLKALCGCGGAVKNGVIEIQGDHRERIKIALEEKGFTVKYAGG